MAKRPGVLELAVLGLLHESPMHGYELRKRLNAVLGSFRAFSYGSLYPCLKACSQARLDRRGGRGRPPRRWPDKRSRIVYGLTAEGKERFQELSPRPARPPGRTTSFGVHFAFFARTDAAIRLRILEGRRSRLEERLDGFRRRWPAPGSGSTATPSSCSGTGWSPSSARSAGSTS